jgi:diadenosine tetraphosphate (Ap4A) HIT family hydrolase
MSCLFCNMDEDRIIMENNFTYAIYDAFPVSLKHALIIPKRHVQTYFDLTGDEVISSNSMIKKLRDIILNEDSRVEGFNIGVNNGEVAGQTILHCHIHLIPRRKNDVDNPRGGIRHVIPGKGYY